jgi:hypothetical protein
LGALFGAPKKCADFWSAHLKNCAFLGHFEKAQFLRCAQISKKCAEPFGKGFRVLWSENFGAPQMCADSAHFSAHP